MPREEQTIFCLHCVSVCLHIRLRSASTWKGVLCPSRALGRHTLPALQPPASTGGRPLCLNISLQGQDFSSTPD